MVYISVAEAAKKWDLSERSVRNYCAIGKILMQVRDEIKTGKIQHP